MNRLKAFKAISTILERVVNKQQTKLSASIKDAQKKVVEYFTNTERPITDVEYHQFAETIGLSPDQAEMIAYDLLSSLFRAGTSKNIDFDFDQNEMAIGMEEEKEHTDNLLIAHKITLDHLKEDPKYYTKLKEIGL